MRWQEKKVKFQKDPPSRRLGNLAVNLNRVGVFAEKNTPESVFNLLSESIRFIEWTAPEVNPEVAEQLVRYQVQLSRWCFGWNRIWSNATEKENLVLQTKSMSDFILGVM